MFSQLKHVKNRPLGSALTCGHGFPLLGRWLSRQVTWTVIQWWFNGGLMVIEWVFVEWCLRFIFIKMLFV